ncbi:MAG: GNAT family N-acetyltransferase [Negativicutes bacterium]|nr:GNAT family N-acetyltransferase [Negativicutes bacterium]
MTIRFASFEDYAQTEKIAQEIQQIHVNLRPDIYKEVAEVIGFEAFRDLSSKQAVIVAEINGKIVGYAVYYLRNVKLPIMHERKVLDIDAIAVSSLCRSQGIGTQMVLFLKEIARSNGCGSIELSVSSQNRDAIRWYEKLGMQARSIHMEMKIE